MVLNRRNFIKFLVGGVAGLQITPIPWKLTDDIAIWTQNWPWVPVPPTGEFTETSSVCNLCPGGCGISVRKVVDRAVKIEGRKDYPVNPGGVCPVGMGGLQLLYDESMRFTGPMKRVGPRGAGEFVQITWGEAFDILGARISDLRLKGLPQTIAAVDGNPSETTVSLLIQRLMKAIGSPNYVRIPSIADTYAMGNLLMQGEDAPMAYDLENADYVLSFGCGLLEGWGAPARVMNAWGDWHEENPSKRSTRVVQIESRASNTASKADAWIAARPGTDAALALGIAHVIIKEELYDKSFVDESCFAFDDWRTVDGENHRGFKTVALKYYSPESAGKISGVEPKSIVKLAREFAKAKAPVAIYGKGKNTLNGGLYEFMAVHSLNALVGSINRPGGVLLPGPLPLSPLPEMVPDATARQGLRYPRLDQAGTTSYPFSRSLINNLVDAMLETPKSPVDTLLVFSANPAFTMPDGGRFNEALKKVPFIVSFSPYRDETAVMADLVLPDDTYLEKTDETVWPVGLQYPLYGLSSPVVERVYDTMNTGDVVMGLARAIDASVGSAFPWEEFEEVLQERAEGLFDAGGGLVHYDPADPAWDWEGGGNGSEADYESFEDMWEEMKSGGLWYRPVYSLKDRPDPFKTSSGKFEFCSPVIEEAIRSQVIEASEETIFEGMTHDETVLRLSRLDEDLRRISDLVLMGHYAPLKPEVERSEYPFLVIPYEMINLASGWIPNPPFLYKTIFETQLLKNESFAEINPKTAEQNGLKEGDRVLVTSPAGQVQVRVNLFEGAMPGVIYLPLGFGHTAYDEFLKGKGVNANDIIQARKDPLSGHMVWWNTPAKIMKV